MQVQELLARRFPKPDVPSRLRKLPTRRSHALAAAASQPSLAAAASQPSLAAAASQPSLAAVAPQPSLAAVAPQPSVAAVAPQPSLAAAAPQPSKAVWNDAPEQVQPPVGVGAGPSIGRHPATRMEPLSGTSYRLQLLLSAALKQKLEQARDLLSHANPSGDFSSVIERALDLLLDRVKRERFAQTKCPAGPEGRGRSSTAPDRGRSGVTTGTRSRAAAAPRCGPSRERIPSEVRRAVALRDGLSCSYMSHDGRRCSSRAFLEIHHEQAWALGGPDTIDNLRLLCRSHNHLLAEQDFGASHVRASIEQRRLARDESGRLPPTSRAESHDESG